MAERVLVEFNRGWGRYNKGEVAGFEKAKAEELCGGDNPVAKRIRAIKKAAPAASLEEKDLAQRSNELGARETAADDRETELDAREAQLNAREQALKEAEAAAAKPADGKGNSGEAGAPPAPQGKK